MNKYCKYRHRWLQVLIPALVLVSSAHALSVQLAAEPASNPLTNYKSGISLELQGNGGKDYVFECWYHDPLMDDHGVVYIRDSTKIAFAHNDRNTAWIKGPSVVALETVAPDKGVIRYRVDRDLNYGKAWVDNTFPSGTSGSPLPAGNIFPAFEAPFSFSELTYAPDDPAVPVVGSIGPKPGIDIPDRAHYYNRGMLDACGDEWHIITVGDDDTGVDADYQEQARQLASDGKIHYFIVNPKTPAVFFTTATDSAQFYTTPPKNYFIPVLYEQTSYVTDGVKIHLANIMNENPVYYRWDGNGPFQKYTGPITADSLTAGEHSLETYYQQGCTRTRRIVKNPPFPSDSDRFTDGSGHGHLLWKNDQEFQQLKTRLTAPTQDPDLLALQNKYKTYKTNRSAYGNAQQSFDDMKHKGLKLSLWSMNMDAPMINALVAAVEGLDQAELFASYAKQMIMENEFLYDWVGYELDQNFSAQPGDNYSSGYYKARPLIASALAYDLLIKQYRQPEFPNGFTPIEDLKVRDTMAEFAVTALMWRGGYTWAHQYLGMWGTARGIGALVAALAMPSYNTPYRGTSGFDGTPATVKAVPFPDQVATWKELFYECDVPKLPYPNQQIDYLGIDGSKGPPEFTWTTPTGRSSSGEDGYIAPDGTSHIGTGNYTAYSIMGIIAGIYSDVIRVKFDRKDAYLDLFFEKCNNGTQPPDVRHSSTNTYFPNLLGINEYHDAAIARMSLAATKASGDFSKLMDVYGLIWVRPDQIPQE